jgi:hypothetical protein
MLLASAPLVSNSQGAIMLLPLLFWKFDAGILRSNVPAYKSGNCSLDYPIPGRRNIPTHLAHRARHGTLLLPVTPCILNFANHSHENRHCGEPRTGPTLSASIISCRFCGVQERTNQIH